MGQLTAPCVTIGNIVVGGTPGSVLFVGAGSVLAQDNANFFWNDTTNQLLLGDGSAATPSHSFGLNTDSGIFNSPADNVVISAGGAFIVSIQRNNVLTLRSTTSFGWNAGTDPDTTPDLILRRDTAQVLAQRNGTAAQTHRIYNTFTDAANYERVSIFAAAGSSGVIHENAGTGTARPMVVGTTGAANTRLRTSGTDRWIVGTTNGDFVANTDNATDIGATGASRPRSIYVGTSIQIEANQGLRLTNQVDGAAAAAGTLGNAPSAGDPAFWIPITLNGNTRYIPAWA